jgi:tRNA(Ile)-lysidine synthase
MLFTQKILALAGGGKQITVAISGGIDSFVALYFLSERKNLNVRAFHFNHKIRPQNDLMEAGVRNFCEQRGVELIIKSNENQYVSGSKEDFYRKERYKAMEGLGIVVTAHHLGDFAESYLMNCFKGHSDYVPMPLVTKYETFTIVRPLALATKEEIIRYAKSNFLDGYVVEDETNHDQVYQRNWVRNNLLPQINSRGYNIHTVVRKKINQKVEELKGE